MKRRFALLFALLPGACAPSSSPALPAGAAPSARTSIPAALAGCYRLLFGDWSSMDDRGARVLEHDLPPGRVELAAGPHRYRGGAGPMHPFLPAPGYHAAPQFAFSAWAPAGRDSIDAVWGHGMGGIAMRLAVRGDTLRGHAHASSDDRQPEREPHAPVAALRVPCSQSIPGEVDVRVDTVLHQLVRRGPP